jgi:low affinity Fe/Cu permease
MKSKKSFREKFTTFSAAIIKFTGSPYAFGIALCLIIIWAALGPVFKFSNTWQLVVNSGTTIITFLMVFLIQQSQNRDTLAMQLKLNELIASSKGCSNRLIDIEDLTEAELETLKKFYVKLAALSKKEQDIHATHSIDEAVDAHAEKHGPKAQAKKGTGKAE